MKKSIYTTAILAIALASCQTKEITADFIQINRDTYTFTAEATDTLKVLVQAQPDWTCIPSNEWIGLEKRNDTLVVSVTPNEGSTNRTGTVTVKAGENEKYILIDQLFKCFNGRFVELTDLADVVCSRSCTYVCGLIAAEEKGYTIPVRINTATGEREHLDPVPLDRLVEISDDGQTIIFQTSGGAKSVIWKNGEITEPASPEGWRGSPQIYGLSADCSVMVGTCKNEENDTRPIKWVNGEPTELPVPEFGVDGEPTSYSIIARGCSGDGSVIFGVDWGGRPRGFMYWKNDELVFTGRDLAEVVVENGRTYYNTVVFQSHTFCASHNGEYIAAYFEDQTTGCHYPVVVNTETNEVQINRCLESARALTMGDDGTCFGGSPSTGGQFGHIFDMENGTEIPISQWFKDKYGITMEDNRFVYRTYNGIYFGVRSVETLFGPKMLSWYYVSEDYQPAE